MICPHCRFPLILGLPTSGMARLACGTCRAVLEVTVITIDPPSIEWRKNPRKNLGHHRQSYCQLCGEVCIELFPVLGLDGQPTRGLCCRSCATSRGWPTDTPVQVGR